MKYWSILLVLLIGATLQAKELFPETEPFETGYLEVDDVHKIFYLRLGNPEGKPVMCLHGGPGVGSYPRMAQYFDPEKYHIVLHDQRGAGRSQPHGELKGNTTQNLVEDIEKLRNHLELDQVLIAGGSWGTTLGLAYAETYPDNVTGLILRGIFLGTEEEVLFHYMGTANFYPEEHAALLAVLPEPKLGTHPDYLYELITGDDKELRQRVLDALHRFELKFMKLHMPDEVVDGYVKSIPEEPGYRMSLMDLTYVKNRYFLKDDQLLRAAGRIKHLPAVLIQGRYDMAAIPISAFRLHRALPKSKLVIVEEAGHSESEDGITAALIEAAASFE